MLLSGCAVQMSQQAQAIKIAMLDQVTHCSRLADVTGVSLAPPNTEANRLNPKTDALELAVHAGATHVVWVSFVEGGVRGQSYKCP